MFNKPLYILKRYVNGIFDVEIKQNSSSYRIKFYETLDEKVTYIIFRKVDKDEWFICFIPNESFSFIDKAKVHSFSMVNEISDIKWKGMDDE